MARNKENEGGRPAGVTSWIADVTDRIAVEFERGSAAFDARIDGRLGVARVHGFGALAVLAERLCRARDGSGNA